MKDWRSRAAWYSAFSDRSPCERASAMARMIAGRSCDLQRPEFLFQPLQPGGGHRKLLHGVVLQSSVDVQEHVM